MALDFFPLFPRSLSARDFERSVFALLRTRITDKKAFSEELAGTENLSRIPSADPKRQKMAAELYLLLERNIAEEQVRNPIPREKLREEIFIHCHPQIAAGNFALLFLPHYERQIKLFEKFTDLTLEKAQGVIGEKEYGGFMKYAAGSDPLFRGAIEKDGIAWKRIEARVSDFTPAVQRDTIQTLLKHLLGALSGRMVDQLGELRAELAYRDLYGRFYQALDFIEDAPKVLLLIPDNFLSDERIDLMGKTELEEQLRQKNKALETTIAEVQGEKIKLSELSREELEKKVQERTAELVSALTAAETARKNLEEFSSLATHELRTPIAAMKGYINLILSDKLAKLSDQQKKYIDAVGRADDHLLTLVNAMLDVSRIELGTLAVDPVSTKLTDVADAVLLELDAKIKEKKQKVIKQYEPNLPSLMLDTSLIHAIVINLLSNAVKYTGTGGTVTITLEKHETDALITVADTGLGIPKAQQGRIFEKLFRADNARTETNEGTGLGLYLVKSITTQTGGKIWFESEENKGTKFFVTIPLSGMQKKEGTKGLS